MATINKIFLVKTAVITAVVFAAFSMLANSSYRISFEQQAYARCLPYYFYLTKLNENPPTELDKGQLVVVSTEGFEEYFGTRDRLMKLVLGKAGDTVKVQGQRIFINDEFVAEIPPQAPHEIYKEQEYVIPEDHAFFGGVTTTTVDSRYLGPLPLTQVIGEAHAII